MKQLHRYEKIGNISGILPMLLGFLALGELIFISANSLPINCTLAPFSIIIVQFTFLVIQQLFYNKAAKELQEELKIWEESLKNSYVKKK